MGRRSRLPGSRLPGPRPPGPRPPGSRPPGPRPPGSRLPGPRLPGPRLPGTSEAKREIVQLCPKVLLSSYPVLHPKYTTFSFKNFKSAIDFNFESDDPVKSGLCEDVKPTHIRNKQLLDLPLKVPKCCYDAYNANVARQKQKKLQKFGMTSPVRVPDGGKDAEKAVEKICDEDQRKEIPEEKITYFPECYLLEDSGSDDEPEDVYRTCSSGSESECSACSTLGGGTRRKMHKVIKRDWREFLHRPENPCKKIVQEEITKHKSKEFFEAKVRKLLSK